MVVQRHVAHQCLRQIFTTGEAVCFEHIGDAAIETLDHAIGPGCAGSGQAMLDAQCAAKLVKLMIARCLAFTAGKQPVGEFLAIVGEDFVHPDGAGPVQGVEKRAGAGGGLVVLDLHKHPARGAINGHKQIPPGALVGHLGQVFDIDVNEAGLVAFEGLVGRSRRLGFERLQIAHTVATQASVQARARGAGADELAGDRKQIVQGQQQHLSEFDHDPFLRRRERGLKPMRRVRRILKAGPAFPFVDRGHANAKALGKAVRAVRATCNLRSDGRRGACVLVQGNHHDKAPEWTAGVMQRLSTNRLMTVRAMNNG